MTQIVLNISDNSILPGLKKVLSRIVGIEKVSVLKADDTDAQKKRQRFLADFRQAVSEAQDLKNGNSDFATWEDLMHEL